ncbi:MAG: SDR family oxidoreductase [Ignavibacteriae bacterium]|nr:SDR family oxidoreductase [Ignavibacteriota bacterium]
MGDVDQRRSDPLRFINEQRRTSMLTNNVAIITGASSGIGAALARLLAAEGATVVLAARRVDKLHELSQEIQALGGNAVVHPCDVTVKAEAEHLIRQTHLDLKRIDILVNNAGRGHFASIEDTTDEMIQSMFKLNVYALWYAVRPVLPIMKQQGRGHIISVASMAGKLGYPYNSAYVAAKHAAVGFMLALRQELAETGIHATVVCPGSVLTDWASVTEGGSMLPMFSASGPVIKRIAKERGISLPHIEGVMPAETVARKILECIYNPVAELYTHNGAKEFVEFAEQNREEAERQQMPIVLGEREVYESLRKEHRPG